MKTVKLVVRILLGAGMVFFGLNKFGGWVVPPVNAEMEAFMGSIASTGFLMQLIAVVEIVTGLMLLINKYVPLALVVMLPVMIVAFLAHLVMDPGGIGGSAVFLLMIIFMMIWNKGSYVDVMKA